MFLKSQHVQVDTTKDENGQCKPRLCIEGADVLNL